MNILSRFPSWLTMSQGTLNWLWQQKDEDGYWDFGSQTSFCIDFPISESWRKPLNRRVDYSTCALALLRRVFD
jgi:hypothetical protein